MGDSLRSRIFRDGLLDGQVVVISGAGSGFGRETALEMLRLGATVIGCGRRTETLEETESRSAGHPVGAGAKHRELAREQVEPRVRRATGPRT